MKQLIYCFHFVVIMCEILQVIRCRNSFKFSTFEKIAFI